MKKIKSLFAKFIIYCNRKELVRKALIELSHNIFYQDVYGYWMIMKFPEKINQSKVRLNQSMIELHNRNFKAINNHLLELGVLQETLRTLCTEELNRDNPGMWKQDREKAEQELKLYQDNLQILQEVLKLL